MLRNLILIGLRNVPQVKVSGNIVRLLPQSFVLEQRCTNLKQVSFYCTKILTQSGETIQNVEQKQEETEIDPEREKRMKIFLLEIEANRQEGKCVPDPALLKPDEWDHILELKSRSARLKYYNFLFKNEKKRENQERKKIEKRAANLERFERMAQERAEEKHITYGLHNNTMFLRIYDSTMDFWHNNRLTRAMQFNQKLIIDCSYEKHMIYREAKYAAKQLMLVFAENRIAEEPFDVHYCNADSNGEMMKQFHKYIPRIYDMDFPVNVHPDSYLDMFPKEKLVYLTPHCKKDLLEYSHDDIYIVGGMVDKISNEPVSLAKAKSQGLRMARLPLDHYLQWGGGSGKSLTINQMIEILLEMKKSNDWNKALQYVPRRKLVNERKIYDEEEDMEDKVERLKDYRFN